MQRFYTPLVSIFLGTSMLWALNAQADTGDNCSEAQSVIEGSYTAPHPDYWYSFDVPATGTYIITTCDLSNTCNTKIYIYDHCDGLTPTELAEGTMSYNDDFCDLQSRVSTIFMEGTTIYIRIGDYETDCAGSEINWSLTYTGELAGCMDPYACNYSPLAMVGDGSCIYPGDPSCPSGPDLVLDPTYFDGDIGTGWGSDFQLTTEDADNAYNTCYIDEGSLTGPGMRTVIKFGIRIWNYGDEDYHIGTAAESPYIIYDPCHGHNHYIDYGEYLLYDSTGVEIPVGHKNGFAVMDLCGMGVYNGYNMGISSGCYDAYGLGTGGQWIDITDVPDGVYTLVARVNWANHPDLEGDVETNLANNWLSRCIHIWRDIDGTINAEMADDCPVYLDCLGEIWGDAVIDCEGNCNGWHQLGDLNEDTTRTFSDVDMYVDDILANTIVSEMCNDANNDGDIDVVDAAFVMACANQDLGYTHETDMCTLPQERMSLTDTVTFSIGNINPAFNYLDIYSLNPSARVLAAQFSMQGLTIDSVVNLCPETYATDYELTWTDDEVIAIGKDEVPYQVHFEPIPTFRIFYTATYPADLCIKHFTAAVKDNFEEVVTAMNENCVHVDATGVEYLEPNPLNVQVVPNPFSGSAKLSFTNFTGKEFTITLSDISGTLLRTYHTTGNFITLEQDELPAGMYFYRITGESKNQAGSCIIQ